MAVEKIAVEKIAVEKMAVKAWCQVSLALGEDSLARTQE
jgi:hypothetical protein